MERLQLINQTVSVYVTSKRKKSTLKIDQEINEELTSLEGYYYRLTRNKGIADFKAVLKTKWKAVYVSIFSI